MTDSKNTKITVSIDKSVKEVLDQLSKYIDIPVSKVARNLIYTSIDDHKILDFLGLGKRIHYMRLSKELIKDNEIKNSNESLASDDEVQISIVLDEKVKIAMDKYSKKLGIPMKSFARNLIYIGLQNVTIVKKTGVLALAKAFQTFLHKFKEISEKD